MAGKIIALRIDVTKIEKARLFEGKKGKYLDAVVFYNEETDEYGANGMIVQSVSEEERKAGTRGPILGNCKVLGGGSNVSESVPQTEKKTETKPAASTTQDVADDLPF